MQVNSHISSLDISSNSMGDEGGMGIATMLQINSTLTNLFVSGCGLKTTSLIAISTVLQSNSSIQQFDISNNVLSTASLSQSTQTDIMTHLSVAIKINSGIKVLDISKMGINDFTLINLLAPALESNKTIEVLNLSR